MVKVEKMETIGCRISRQEKEQLQRLAAREDLTLSQIIRRACKNLLEKEQEKQE